MHRTPRVERRVTQRRDFLSEEALSGYSPGAVPGTLVPSHLPNTCPWAPGYLEAWLYSYTFTSWGLQYFPTPAADTTMPTCPHPACPCGHKNVTADALINHVRSSPWAALYFCAACKCVCRSETALIHVGASGCVSEDPPHADGRDRSISKRFTR